MSKLPKLRSIKNYRNFNKATAGIGITLFAAIGTILLFNTRAVGPFASIEPEQGTRTVNAAIVGDNSASGGSAVKFSSSGSGRSDLTDFFPIGVFVQPTYNFDTWKARGINTVVEVPQGNDLEQWTVAAKSKGLHMIRAPRPNPADDIGENLLLAWGLPDEPDLYNTPASQLMNSYNAWKAIDPSRPVYLNFAGGVVNGLQGNCNESCYRSYIAAADWISNDIYPVTGWNQPDQLAWVGQAIDRLTGWSGTRPQFAYIETGDQGIPDSSFRGVTPGELREEIWDAIIHGARGIWYFPVSLEPFSFDNTPPSVVDEMVKQNATITSLASVLQGPINPPTMGATPDFHLELTWRDSPSGKYVIVLNMHNDTFTDHVIGLTGIGSATTATVIGENRTESLTGSIIVDDFGPYSVHIYRIN